jgi:hypothetical protein
MHISRLSVVHFRAANAAPGGHSGQSLSCRCWYAPDSLRLARLCCHRDPLASCIADAPPSQWIHWWVLKIDLNQAHTINRSVAVHNSDTPLERLPRLHPGHLLAKQTANPPSAGGSEHNEVRQVPQSRPHTLAVIRGWNLRALFRRIHRPAT